MDLIKEENIFNALQYIDLQNIEPFTLVIFQEKQLAEFRWDGTEKHLKILFPYDIIERKSTAAFRKIHGNPQK